MDKKANLWEAVKTRYRGSIVLLLGTFTLIGGIFAVVLVLVLGSRAGVLAEPRYLAAIIAAVLWLSSGVGFTIWGWRSNDAEAFEKVDGGS